MMSAANEEVHFIMTGGTIDSAYHGDFDTIEPRENSVIPQYIARVKLARPVLFTQVCMKDSRRLTIQDRQEIAGVIARSSAKKFIVTQGTYTLPETAQFLQSHLGATENVVVLTSSTIPLEGVTMSNGGFNRRPKHVRIRLCPTRGAEPRSACMHEWPNFLTRGVGKAPERRTIHHDLQRTTRTPYK